MIRVTSCDPNHVHQDSTITNYVRFTRANSEPLTSFQQHVEALFSSLEERGSTCCCKDVSDSRFAIVDLTYRKEYCKVLIRQVHYGRKERCLWAFSITTSFCRHVTCREKVMRRRPLAKTTLISTLIPLFPTELEDSSPHPAKNGSAHIL